MLRGQIIILKKFVILFESVILVILIKFADFYSLSFFFHISKIQFQLNCKKKV